MKCKECKWYRPDEPPVVKLVVKNIGDGRGKYVRRKVYRRCAMLFEKLGWMGSCNGSHKYCFEPKEEVNERYK